MPDEPKQPADSPKVFISYSRHDGSTLADELVTGLALAGFEAYLDRHDIEKAVDWEERLSNLILKADTVVFLITPGSVASPRCQWEVDRATELAKRVIPVQWIKVEEQSVPERLRRLNYTIFAEGQSFARPLSELATALRQDVDWIRTHSLIGEQAARWRGRGQNRNADDLLLRGGELEDTRAWLKRRKADAPEITELQRAFIAASEAAEAARLSAEQQRLAERERFAQETELAEKRASFVQITFNAIFRPSRIAPLIKFGDASSLRAALFYWIAVSIIVISTNGLLISFYGADVGYHGETDTFWSNSLARLASSLLKTQ